MQKLKLKMHFYGAGMSMLLAFLLVAGLANVSYAGWFGPPWDGYGELDCRYFVTQYPNQNDACADSLIIMSCNEHLVKQCHNCT